MANAEINRKARGKVVFDNNIVLSIINLATKEIADVSSIVTNYGTLLERWFDRNYSDGVRISNVKEKMVVDVYINVFFGYSVSEIAYKVQENIKNSLASMIEMNIDKVNVHVLGVDFPNEQDF